MKRLTSRLRITKRNHLYIYTIIAFLIIIPMTLLLFSPKNTANKSKDQRGFFSLSAFGRTASPTPSAPSAQTAFEEVSKMVELPTDEEPVIATITDPSMLADQVFFQRAAAGDKVIIYKNAGLAIIYRPDTKKIITSAYVDIQIDQPTPTLSDIPESESTPSAKILKTGLTK